MDIYNFYDYVTITLYHFLWEIKDFFLKTLRSKASLSRSLGLVVKARFAEKSHHPIGINGTGTQDASCLEYLPTFTMINVGKYFIHGVYGVYLSTLPELEEAPQNWGLSNSTGLVFGWYTFLFTLPWN